MHYAPSIIKMPPLKVSIVMHIYERYPNSSLIANRNPFFGHDGSMLCLEMSGIIGKFKCKAINQIPSLKLAGLSYLQKKTIRCGLL